MGMTIDNAIEWYVGLECYTPQAKDARDVAIDTMRKYQQLQADYNARLKADMVAMLTEIQTEIEELDLKDSVPDYQKGAEETREYIADLLQQKIDSLKTEKKNDQK